MHKSLSLDPDAPNVHDACRTCSKQTLGLRKPFQVTLKPRELQELLPPVPCKTEERHARAQPKVFTPRFDSRSARQGTPVPGEVSGGTRKLSPEAFHQ